MPQLDNKISASLMCADLGNLRQEIRKLEKAGVDYLHIDIMDGHFVPNFTFGPDLVKKVRAISKLPLDLHLMVEKPENFMEIWNLKKQDYFVFHWECTHHPQRLLEKIKALGAKAGIALNPATPLEGLEYILDYLDLVLIMTVNPGFAGQKWIPETLKKVEKLKNIIDQRKLKINLQVDGNLGKHNIPLLNQAGANIFVAGSSSIFQDSRYAHNLKLMRKYLKR